MKKLFLFLSLFLISLTSFSQVTTDTIKKEVQEEENDTVLEIIPIEEVIVYKHKLSPEAKKEFLFFSDKLT